MSIKSKKLQTGLSKIENLTVFAVILIFVALAVSFVNPFEYIKKNNDQKRKNDLFALQKILVRYYHDKGVYPASKNYSIVDFKTNIPIAWGQQWIPYMNMLPQDPSGFSHYVYFSSNNNQTYYLYAALEESDDPQRCFSAGPGVCASIMANNIPANACGNRCNFGLSSPNTSP